MVVIQRELVRLLTAAGYRGPLTALGRPQGVYWDHFRAESTVSA